MAKQRSGSPSGEDDQNKASDGWPSWMGAADPGLAPKQPPPARPKPAPKAAPPPRAAAPQRVAPVQARVAAQTVPPAAPASERTRTRPGLRAGVCAVVLLWAFVAGAFAARSQPDAAVRLQQAAVEVQTRLASLLAPTIRLSLALGIPMLLFGLLVWQSGRPRRPRFLAFASILCLGMASIGMIRGGHDIDLERSAANFRARILSLRQELDDWKKGAARPRGASLATLELKLEEAQTDRSKSSMSLQERDEFVASLRREIQELKKKLAEKD